MRRLLALAALLAAATAAAEPFSVAAARLSPDEVGALLDAGRGRWTVVGDRVVDVSSSAAAGRDVFIERAELEPVVARLRAAAVAALRAAALDGRLTEADLARARALAVLHEGELAWRDEYFLDSLVPDDDSTRAAGPGSPPAPPIADDLSRRLRSRLALEDHGDPAQAEALDMALRGVLDSPTGRTLAGEFLRTGRTAKVAFGPLAGVVVGDGKHKSVSGIGGLTSHSDGDRVTLNIAYLQTDPRFQYSQLPGILAHELLGHVLNEIRAEQAGVTAAMNLWRGDEELASLTGWIVQAEADGRIPSDSYLWAYLADPEAYHRALQLVAAYYAESLSPDEATRPAEVYAERLSRVEPRIACLEARLDSGTDWARALDHFQEVHGVGVERLAGLRADLVWSSSAAARVELVRLREIRAALTDDLSALKDPVRRGASAEAAKRMNDPFFADGERRIAAFAGSLRGVAAKSPTPYQVFPTAPDRLSWREFSKMLEDDRRDHPEHWASPAPGAPPPSGAILGR